MSPKSVEEKKLILNVKELFDKEKTLFENAVNMNKLKKEDIPIKYSDVCKRTAQALKVSERMVYKLARESRSVDGILAPKNKNAGRKKIVLDSFDEGVIRRIILTAYSNKIVPTVEYVHRNLRDDPYFPEMSITTLQRIMKRQLKFKFGKFEGKPVPLDRPDIASDRAKYLRQVRKFRRQGYQIFYQDETWVNQNIFVERGWHIPEQAVAATSQASNRLDPWLRGVGIRFRDRMLGGVSSRPSGAGKRIILINIGSNDGFLGVGKEFIGKKDSADYHSEMNAQHFAEWFAEVLSILPNKAVVVLDQASYHTAITEESRNPTTNYRKAQLVSWLEQKGVAVPNDEESFSEMTRPELLELCRQNANTVERNVDKLLAQENSKDPSRDIHILWLPVAHCELNPIELIWAAVKDAVRKRNRTFKMKELLPIVQEVIQLPEIDQFWQSCCRHVIALEEMIMHAEKIAEDFLESNRERIIINLGESSSESDTSSDEE